MAENTDEVKTTKKEKEIKTTKERDDTEKDEDTEDEDEDERPPRKRVAQRHNPDASLFDVTKEFLSEWDVFKKRNPTLFVDPIPPKETPPKIEEKKPHSHTCIFGDFCPVGESD